MRALAVGALLGLVVLSGCSSAGSDPIPGDFRGYGDGGLTGISVTVNGASAIPEMSMSYTCGSVSHMVSNDYTPPLTIEDGVFTVEGSDYEIKGRFGGDGSVLTGSWRSGSCSGDWRAERKDTAGLVGEGEPGSAGGEELPTTSPTVVSTTSTTSTTMITTISAAEPEIAIGDLQFRITALGFDTTCFGLTPPDGIGAGRVMFVEFALLSGDRTAFESLEAEASASAGSDGLDPVGLVSDGRFVVLADLKAPYGTTFRAGSSLLFPGDFADHVGYLPNAESITWVYVVSGGADQWFLNFSSGEIIDLSGAPGPGAGAESAAYAELCEVNTRMMERAAAEPSDSDDRAAFWQQQIDDMDLLVELVPEGLRADMEIYAGAWRQLAELLSEYEYSLRTMLDSDDAGLEAWDSIFTDTVNASIDRIGQFLAANCDS